MNRYPLGLLVAYAVVFVALGIDPLYRHDWLLESVLPLVVVPFFVFTHRRLRFSNLAYTALFVFLVLHTIGSHYTYAEVPYQDWLGIDTGRNHFDRLVHFSYGLLMAPLVFELFEARAPSRGLWRFLFPALFLTSHGVIYEIIEWWAAVLFGGDLGQAFLGTQGDEWDAQKDVALATLGAFLGTGAMLWWRRRA